MAITERSDITSAHRQLMKTLRTSAKPLETGIGWPGGHKEGTVYWNSRQRVWTHSFESKKSGRYIIFVGTKEPQSGKQVPINFEVNPPFEGRDLRCAGAFVRDSAGEVYLTHSGKIGGGYKGVGKKAFLDWYGRDKLDELTWPGARPSQSVILGPIDSKKLLKSIVAFSSAVRRFKDEVRAGETVSITERRETPTDFQPEFSGTKTYTTREIVEARCDHGIVVQALRSHLEIKGKRVGNDGNRDLFIQSRTGRITHLYEVKTRCTLPDLTKAVGQVMVYSALDKPAPKLTLVFPRGLSAKCKRMLKALELTLLEYEWDGETPRFRNLEEALLSG